MKKKQKKKTKRKAKRSKSRKRKPTTKTMKISSGNRRKFRRLPICAAVRGNPLEPDRLYGTRNISAGGLFLFTNNPPTLGSSIHLEIAIEFFPGIIELECKVVHIEKDKNVIIGCGVEFLNISNPLKRIFEKLERAFPE